MIRIRLLAASGAVLILTGCGVLPDQPGPLEPTPRGTSTSEHANPHANSDSPDGFQPAQRIAVRVRNVGCLSMSHRPCFAPAEYKLATNRDVIEDSSELQSDT